MPGAVRPRCTKLVESIHRTASIQAVFMAHSVLPDLRNTFRAFVVGGLSTTIGSTWVKIGQREE